LAAYKVTETRTRYSLIDPQLKKAGWNLSDRSQIGIEIPVSGYDKTDFAGFSDYCLYDDNGDVLAVIEAKRTCRDARDGKEPSFNYTTETAVGD